MSCDSTNYTSTSYCIPSAIPASKALAGFEWFRQKLSAWLADIGSERRHQLRQLLDLDDRLLADIGLSRAQVASGASRSSWDRLALWQIYR
jgi:uncharacterized protein YjiS (DUF1127 family)